jgi:NAD(P)-dependent dehydrogenase (short-subunit alcohol dehydrogenase family)
MRGMRMDRSMSNRHRTALIIGASSHGGLGEAVARRLHADGARMIVAGRRADALNALAQQLDGRAIRCDLTDEDSIAAMIAAAGPIDVLVNAAGTTAASRLTKITREQIESQFATHVTANMLLLKHAAGAMQASGSIILFSSITAQMPGEGLAAYGCAKAAVEHLARIAALEFSDQSIRVNAVAPGFSQTPMTKGIFANPAIRDLYLGECPLGARAVTAEEVAATVAWLADPLCFTTGETLQVSGGAQLAKLPRLAQLREARRA